jgi:hypothetical protein
MPESTSRARYWRTGLGRILGSSPLKAERLVLSGTASTLVDARASEAG